MNWMDGCAHWGNGDGGDSKVQKGWGKFGERGI